MILKGVTAGEDSIIGAEMIVRATLGERLASLD